METIEQKFLKLPRDLQQEVIDFIVLKKQKRNKVEDVPLTR